MNYFEAILLAIIQGLTEFLPVSSSAHLILFSEISGGNQNLFYDVSLHLGTLIAVMFYFKSVIKEIFRSITKDRSLIRNQLSRNLIISSIPTLILGYILVDFIDVYLRTSLIIAFTTIFFAMVLYLATFKPQNKDRFIRYIDYRCIGDRAISIIISYTRDFKIRHYNLGSSFFRL